MPEISSNEWARMHQIGTRSSTKISISIGCLEGEWCWWSEDWCWMRHPTTRGTSFSVHRTWRKQRLTSPRCRPKLFHPSDCSTSTKGNSPWLFRTTVTDTFIEFTIPQMTLIQNMFTKHFQISPLNIKHSKITKQFQSPRTSTKTTY